MRALLRMALLLALYAALLFGDGYAAEKAVDTAIGTRIGEALKLVENRRYEFAVETSERLLEEGIQTFGNDSVQLVPVLDVLIRAKRAAGDQVQDELDRLAQLVKSNDRSIDPVFKTRLHVERAAELLSEEPEASRRELDQAFDLIQRFAISDPETVARVFHVRALYFGDIAETDDSQRISAREDMKKSFAAAHEALRSLSTPHTHEIRYSLLSNQSGLSDDADEEIEYTRQALSIREQVDSDKPALILEEMDFLGETLVIHSRTHDLIRLGWSRIQLSEKAFGANHEQVIGSLSSQASVLQSLGEEKAAEILERRIGELDPDFLEMRKRDLDLTTSTTAAPPEAVDTQNRSKKKRTKTIPEAPHFVNGKSSEFVSAALVRTRALRRAGRNEEAVAQLEGALSTLEKADENATEAFFVLCGEYVKQAADRASPGLLERFYATAQKYVEHAEPGRAWSAAMMFLTDRDFKVHFHSKRLEYMALLQALSVAHAMRQEHAKALAVFDGLLPSDRADLLGELAAAEAAAGEYGNAIDCVARMPSFDDRVTTLIEIAQIAVGANSPEVVNATLQAAETLDGRTQIVMSLVPDLFLEGFDEFARTIDDPYLCDEYAVRKRDAGLLAGRYYASLGKWTKAGESILNIPSFEKLLSGEKPGTFGGSLADVTRILAKAGLPGKAALIVQRVEDQIRDKMDALAEIAAAGVEQSLVLDTMRDTLRAAPSHQRVDAAMFFLRCVAQRSSPESALKYIEILEEGEQRSWGRLNLAWHKMATGHITHENALATIDSLSAEIEQFSPGGSEQRFIAALGEFAARVRHFERAMSHLRRLSDSEQLARLVTALVQDTRLSIDEEVISATLRTVKSKELSVETDQLVLDLCNGLVQRGRSVEAVDLVRSVTSSSRDPLQRHPGFYVECAAIIEKNEGSLAAVRFFNGILQAVVEAQNRLAVHQWLGSAAQEARNADAGHIVGEAVSVLLRLRAEKENELQSIADRYSRVAAALVTHGSGFESRPLDLLDEIGGRLGALGRVSAAEYVYLERRRIAAISDAGQSISSAGELPPADFELIQNLSTTGSIGQIVSVLNATKDFQLVDGPWDAPVRAAEYLPFYRQRQKLAVATRERQLFLENVAIADLEQRWQSDAGGDFGSVVQRHHAQCVLNAWSGGHLENEDAASALLSVHQQLNFSEIGDSIVFLYGRLSSANAVSTGPIQSIQTGPYRQLEIHRELAQIFAEGNGSREQVGPLLEEFDAIDRQRTDFRTRIQSEHSDFLKLILSEPVSLAALKARLAEDEVMLSFELRHDQPHVVAVRREQSKIFRLRAPSWLIARLTRSLLAELREPTGGDVKQLMDDDFGPAVELYSRLIKPLEAFIKKGDKLIVVGNTHVSLVPFHVLLKEPISPAPSFDRFRRAKWLANDYTVGTVPSISAWVGLEILQDGPLAPKGLFAAGEPVPGRLGRHDFSDLLKRYEVNLEQLVSMPELPEAGRELTAVARVMHLDEKERDEAILRGPAATEERIKKSKLSDYRVILFATHGFRYAENGVHHLSLVLTPPQRATALDDGLLTGPEIAEMALNAELVVLSACESGVQSVRPTRYALHSLTHAFFFAGTRAVLSANWTVGSAAAAELTPRFFQAISRGEDKLQALSYAMREVREDRNVPHHAHPLFWGTFSLMGDTRPFSLLPK